MYIVPTIVDDTPCLGAVGRLDHRPSAALANDTEIESYKPHPATRSGSYQCNNNNLDKREPHIDKFVPEKNTQSVVYMKKKT